VVWMAWSMEGVGVVTTSPGGSVSVFGSGDGVI
jgi:hypothetical protein